MFEHHPSTVCGWLGASGTQDLRAPRLWQRSRQWRAHCRGAARLLRFATGCRLQRRSSVNILTAWPGRVAQAPRAGRALAPWSCWRPSRDAHGWRDQLGLDGESNSTLSGLMPPFSTLILFLRIELESCRWKCDSGTCRPAAGHFRRRFANF